jgi:hypothetical protein
MWIRVLPFSSVPTNPSGQQAVTDLRYLAEERQPRCAATPIGNIHVAEPTPTMAKVKEKGVF